VKISDSLLAMPKRASLKGPGRCIFCGQTGLSKEHIWSAWTYALVPTIKDGHHTRGVVQSAKDDPKKIYIESLRNHNGSTNTVKLHVVCKRDCNNGWMSRLDERAKPILSPLIMGQPAVLSVESQTVVAAWAAMKMMVSEFSRRIDVSTAQDERTFLMKELRPPPNWKIWIAHTQSEKWRSAYYRNSSMVGRLNEAGVPVAHEGSLRKNTQSISIGIGQLFISAISSNVPGVEFHAPADAKRHIRQIWPAAVGGCFWPPGTIFTTSAADAFAESFSHFMKTLNWTPAAKS